MIGLIRPNARGYCRGCGFPPPVTLDPAAADTSWLSLGGTTWCPRCGLHRLKRVGVVILDYGIELLYACGGCGHTGRERERLL